MATINDYQYVREELLGAVNRVFINNDLYVCNLFTQKHYGNDGAKYADAEMIRIALKEVVIYFHEFLNRADLPIYIPKIGCGLGGLDWDNEVRPVIENIERVLKTEITVLEYNP